VHVGLVFSSGACTVFHTQPNIRQEARETRAVVQDVLNRWGDSDALGGWYLVDEPALA
jgi:hypothetical protein